MLDPRECVLATLCCDCLIFAELGVDFAKSCDFAFWVFHLCFECLVGFGETLILLAKCGVDVLEASEFVGVFFQLCLELLVGLGLAFNLFAKVSVENAETLEFLIAVFDLVVPLSCFLLGVVFVFRPCLNRSDFVFELCDGLVEWGEVGEE